MIIRDGNVGVLYVDSFSGMGGAESGLLELAIHLDHGHFTPYLLTSSDGLLSQRFREAGIQAFTGDFPFFSKRRPWLYWRAVWRIVSLIRRNHIAIVHVNCDRAVPHAVLASKIARVRCVCHIRDMLRAWFLPSYVRYLNWADWIVANSWATAEKCLAAGMNGQRLSVIHSCFDMQRFVSTDSGERHQFRTEFNLAKDAVAIGLIGHILKHKGHEDFINAAHIVAAHCPNTKFFIIGDDTSSSDEKFLPYLHHLIEQYGLSHQFIFAGFRTEIPAVMTGLDIITVPSWDEPFGRVVVEALASQRPVVASRSGGIPEIVDDGITGLLFPPRDYARMAEHLLRLCDDAELRTTMGRKGPTAVAKFDAQHHTRQIDKLYLSMLAKQ